MAITLIGSNLNTLGNAGNFETDRSTWGFANASGVEVTRSIDQSTKGNSSAKVRALSSGNNLVALSGAFTAVLGKKYIAKAKIKTTPWGTIVGTPYYFGQDGVEFKINVGFASNLNIDSAITKTVADAKDTWVQIEALISVSYASPSSVYIGWDAHGYSVYNPNAFFFIDEFEIYEYEDVVVAPCDLAINVGSSVVVNESDVDENDGSIQVAITGGTGPFEYSKDNGATWQDSNQFTGLGNGIYQVKARVKADHGCESYEIFVVNLDTVTFDFSTIVTDESVSGATDGKINVTTTGTGAPFTFSIDLGTYGASNLFESLAAGDHIIAVKDAAGNIVAKKVTVGSGISLFEKVSFNRNPMTYTAGAKAGYEALTNYRGHLDVRVEDIAGTSAYNSKLKMEIEPDSSGQLIFYLRQAFRGVLTATPPSLNEGTIKRLTDRIKFYKNYLGHLQDDQVTPPTTTASNPFLVLLGGISKVHYPGLNFFTSYLPTNKKFMSWAPVEKYVDSLQEDYLNFWVYSSFTALKLVIKAYYDDATTATSTLLTQSPVQYGQLYQLPAGPANSGVKTITPAKNLVKYELWLTNESDFTISEVRTYIIDPVSYPNRRFYMFLNSLGSYEVLRFYGKRSMETKSTRSIIQKHLAHDYDPLAGEFEVNNPVAQDQFSISSGYFEGKYAAEWLEYMKELLLTRRLYDITNGTRVPMVIITDSLPGKDDDSFLRFVRLQVKEAYENQNYTPDII